MAENAGATTSTAIPSSGPRKTSARAYANEAALEHEADRAASIATSRRRGLPPASLTRLQPGNRSRMPGGSPIDPAIRTDMESVFGYDFSDVRLHDDARAAENAEVLRAAAYTRGADIAYARGEYDTSSSAGIGLLAHELAHVVQQDTIPGLRGTVQRKPDPAKKTVPEAAPVWYQEAIDQVELEERRQAENVKNTNFKFESVWYPNMLAIRDLCEAVDQKLKDKIPARLDAVLKEGLSGIMPLMSRELMNEVTARMYEMGLEKDANRLREAYAEVEKSGPYKDDIYKARRTVEYLTRLVAGAERDTRTETAADVTATMHRYARVYIPLREEYARLDFEAIAWERQTSRGYVMVLRPGMSHEEYYHAIRASIEGWHRGFSTAVQKIIDAARRDLESPAPTGTGASLLKALRTALVNEIKPALEPADAKTQHPLGEAFDITKTKMGKGKGTITDAFAEGKEAKDRAVPITTYDPEQEWARELRTTLRRSFLDRMAQIDALGRIYGVVEVIEAGKTAAETEARATEARDTAESIKRTAGGRLRLDSDDDWRDFLLQRYQDLTAPKATPTPAPQGTTSPPAAKQPLSPEDALHEIIKLLFLYMQTFTIHARFTNLYDVGDKNYLNRPFPRALTGQLVHDCGVYALRAAYVLSLVRKELGLRFRFVEVPVHVSLVITGEKHGAYVIQNNHFTRLSATELEARRKQWNDFKDPTTKAKPTGPSDDAQFIGELATNDFIRGPIDMPFRVSDVPKPLKDAKAEQKQLWKYYQAENRELFGASASDKKSDNFRFHLHYLALTEQWREIWNEAFVPFWNDKAPAAWDAFQENLAGKGSAPRAKMKVEDVLTAVGEYRVAFEDARSVLKRRVEDYHKTMRRLSERLRDDPKLVAKGARIAHGLRAQLYWQFYFELHMEAIDQYENDLLNKAMDSDEQLEDLRKALSPQWIPRKDNAVEPID